MAKRASKAGYQEIKGKLGVFGWAWRILLLGWQALMIAWLVQYLTFVAPMVEAGGAPGAGAAIGGTIGVGMIIAIWVAGTIILGLFVLLTRRTKTLVPIADPDGRRLNAMNGWMAR